MKGTYTLVLTLISDAGSSVATAITSIPGYSDSRIAAFDGRNWVAQVEQPCGDSSLVRAIYTVVGQFKL